MAYRGGPYSSGSSYGAPPNSGEYRNRHHQQHPHLNQQQQHQQRYSQNQGYSNGYESYPPFQNGYSSHYEDYNRESQYYSKNYNSNGYHNYRQQQTYSSQSSSKNQPYGPEQQQKQQSHQNSSSSVTPISSGKEKNGTSTSMPIIKTYSLGGTKQGNFLSQLFSSNSEIKETNSFRSSFSKDSRDSKDHKKKLLVEYVDGLSETVEDPRINKSISYTKALSKSYFKPVDKLYLPKYRFDDHSIGDKPSNEIVIWNLHSNTSSMLIRNNISSYGPISEIKMVDDPLTAVPLGLCLLSFDGKIEQAHEIALKVVESCNKKLLIQGRFIRCGLNVNNKLYDEIYEKSINARNEKIRKQKLDELKKEEQKLEKLRKEKLARDEQIRLNAVNKVQNGLNGSGKHLNGNTSIKSSNTQSYTSVYQKPAPSNHDKRILPYSSFSLNYKIQKHIANHPYIFISDKSVSSVYVTSNQLGKFLNRFKISKIIQQRSGFYLIFSKLDNAMECFDNVDGTKFLNYTIFMSLYVPDDEIDETRVGKLGNFRLAQKQINNELNAYLLKDLREKVVGKMILDVLNTDEMVKLATEAKKKKDAELELMKVRKEEPTIMSDPVTVVKRLDLNIFKKNIKKSFVPISHSLNERSEDEASEESEDEDDEGENEDDKNMVIPEPVKRGRKRKADTTPTVVKKKTKTVVADIIDENGESGDNDNLISEGDDEFEENNKLKNGSLLTPDTGIKVQAEEEKIDDIFQPSTKPPGPVFEDDLKPFSPVLDFLKQSIKTERDFKVLKELCKDMTLKNPIKDINFWAWEHLESAREEMKLRENKEEEEADDAEVFDYEDEVLNNKELKNSSGCFRTQGYFKIPDTLKREYLLHRRKLTNLNPVKHEDDDEANTQTHNTIQSSRVNRANTRRFVADISAQKQIIGETDLLDLNQLNKRKKPVQFARSAIHNWGLYALEPINAGEMIIEYVGERIRQQIAELREKNYLRSGIGSSYLFRVDENTVIDASKKGGIARFINHCCEPSCTAKIIKVGGKKRIVIYALRDIKKNEELTYDYKFERELNDEERIVCLCGAPGCKGYLN